MYYTTTALFSTVYLQNTASIRHIIADLQSDDPLLFLEFGTPRVLYLPKYIGLEPSPIVDYGPRLVSHIHSRNRNADLRDVTEAPHTLSQECSDGVGGPYMYTVDII